MRKLALTHHPESGEMRNTAAGMEIEKKNLRAAALSAMASLCVSDFAYTLLADQLTPAGWTNKHYHGRRLGASV